MDEGDIELYPCRCCERRFRPDVLRKHEPICVKSSKKQRKVFDSGKQRADGSDIPFNKTLKPGEIPKPSAKEVAGRAKTSQWRQTHEQFINSLKAARNYTIAKNTGAPLPPPPPPVIDSSLVQCPYCQRRFNEEACNRHVPFCRDQHAKLSKNVSGNKKPIYKAPALKSRQPVPTQKISSISPSDYNSQPSTYSQNNSTRVGMSSNIPARSTKSNLPTRSVVGRPQQSPNQQPMSSAVNSRISNSNSSASRTNHTVKTSATPTSMPMATGKSSALRRPPAGTGGGGPQAPKAAGFCHECGSSFSVATARFCSECGVRRLAV